MLQQSQNAILEFRYSNDSVTRSLCFLNKLCFALNGNTFFSSEPGFNARILNVLYGRNSLFVFALMFFPYLIMEFWKYIFIFKETENVFSVTTNI